MALPKLYIFDLDDTLWDGKQLYPDVKNILHILRKNNNFIYLASFNKKAPKYLQLLGIQQYFHGGAYGYIPFVTKYDMVKECIDHMQRNYNGMLSSIEFYDDLYNNILNVSSKSNGNIRTVHIKNGLHWSHINKYHQ